MATDGYGEGGVGSDGRRGAQASSYAGNPDTSEGAHAFNELSAPKGQRLGEQTQGRSWQSNSDSRQALPDPGLHTDGMWDATGQVNGPKELLGQNPHEPIRDPDRPSMPDPEFPGAGGTTNQGPQGAPLDWKSVAPYEYPEFPKDNSDALVSYTPVWET